MKISVIGLGKLGLPLAVQFARMGHIVVGVDVNARTVELVNAGIEPFPGEHLLKTLLREQVEAGRLLAVTDAADAVPNSDAVVVVVPLYVDNQARPDFTMIDAATEAVGRNLTPGTLVSFETTLPIGTTRDRLTPILAKASGLSAGRDFWVVFSPERVLTGRVFQDLRRYPKLVGGIDEASTKHGAQFYAQVLEFDPRPDLARENGAWALGSAEEAEFAKLAETTFRDVNIALANQFAVYAENHGLDIFRVIEASNSQPYSHIHSPGIAVGGHCIPVYPQLYLSNDPDASIVSTARLVNAAMPQKVVQRLQIGLGTLHERKVLILGAAYRGGVKEAAFSGAFALQSALHSAGAKVLVHDPLFSSDELVRLGFTPFDRGTTVSVAILQADHQVYREWTSADLPGLSALVDGRNFLDPARWSGIRFIRIGVDERA